MEKTINILFDLQLSVLTPSEDGDGDFIFETDSNVNIATFTINGLLEKNPNYVFYVLVPEKHKIVLNRFTDKFIDESRVKLIEYPYFGNSFVERMSFNPRVLLHQLKDVHIDLVYANDSSKVAPYKTFFYMKQNEFVKIITRNQWVTGKNHRKVPKEIDFIIRQVESALYSDFSTFNSKAAIGFLIDNSTEHFNDAVRDELRKKCKAMDTAPLERIDKLSNTNKPDDVPKLLFAHRLSYYTGFDEVFEILDELYAEGLQFKLYTPDPGNKFKQAELHEKHPYIVPIDKDNWTYDDYIKLCWECDVTIGNHNIPVTWGGLCITEPMVAYCAPVLPNKDAYLEMFYDDKEIFFDNKQGMKEIIKRYITDKTFLKEKQSRARKFCEEELSMEKFINEIDSLIQICLTEK